MVKRHAFRAIGLLIQGIQALRDTPRTLRLHQPRAVRFLYPGLAKVISSPVSVKPAVHVINPALSVADPARSDDDPEATPASP